MILQQQAPGGRDIYSSIRLDYLIFTVFVVKRVGQIKVPLCPNVFKDNKFVHPNTGGLRSSPKLQEKLITCPRDGSKWFYLKVTS